MPWYLWVVLIAAILFVIDRIPVWFNIGAKKKQYAPAAYGGSLTSAALGPILDVFQPSHEHVVEEQQRQEFFIDQQESGAPKNEHKG